MGMLALPPLTPPPLRAISRGTLCYFPLRQAVHSTLAAQVDFALFDYHKMLIRCSWNSAYRAEIARAQR